MSAVVIVLHIVVSALTSCLCVSTLMRTRGVRGVRALQRDLLDLQADHSATTKRLKKMQTSSAGEASAESKKAMSKTTIDFLAESRIQSPSSGTAIGQ